jgi:hypothetical protein
MSISVLRTSSIIYARNPDLTVGASRSGPLGLWRNGVDEHFFLERNSSFHLKRSGRHEMGPTKR